MRHSQTKPNSSSSKSNVGSGSGSKLVNVSQKGIVAKRISSEPVKCGKKRKLNPGEGPQKGKSVGSHRYQKESDTEKTQKKYNPGVVKKSCVNVKRLKKPNEKFKKVDAKSDKKAIALQKILKKCKVFEKIEERDGPPTLCETFSRITTMVAETVINERENQKLTENLMGKGKKESDGPSSSKNKDGNASEVSKARKGASETSSLKVKKETSAKKVETGRKIKVTSPKTKVSKMKSDVKKGKVSEKKSSEKPTLDNTENMVKVLKDEEIVLAFGKGIGTRRKSTAGSVESEQKVESSEGSKGKFSAKVVKEENLKKVQKVIKKEKTLIRGKKKTTHKAAEAATHTKKSSEEVKKEKEKEKEKDKDKDKDKDKEKDKDKDKDDHSNAKELVQKKVKVKKEPVKLKTSPKKKDGKSVTSLKKKLPAKDVKSPKPKLGSETDGSNSDELTLNIIQKKTKKSRLEAEKAEANGKAVKTESNTEESKVKSEDKASESDKVSYKAKKIKTEKEDKGESVSEKKAVEVVKDTRKSKETESDTDEDLELRKIVAKKFGRTVKIPSEPKKVTESGKSGSETDQRARRMKLFGFWSGPKRHRVASLNALAKVHCLYENESKGVLAEIEKMGQIAKPEEGKMDKSEEKVNKGEKKVNKKSGKDSESEKLDSVVINKRTLRGGPGTRGVGKHWDMFAGDSTTSSASSDESHSDTDRPKDRKLALPPSYRQKMQRREDSDKEECSKAPKRRRNTEIGVTMDLKDMVVKKRMASLNASAILAASYSSEKRTNRKDSSGTGTDDGMSSVEETERFLSADEGDNVNNKTVRKKSCDREKTPEEKNKEAESGSEVIEYKHKKHFWKTKVESLKKLSKEKRNSPSPILAEFGVEKDLSATVFEKEKNDELNDDKEKDKKGSKTSYAEGKGKLKGKSIDGKFKIGKTGVNERESTETANDDGKSKRKYTKRKYGGEEMKNINIEKMSGRSGLEKSDEYEYKSDSDNGKRKLIELRNTGGSNKKVAVIVNQDTDVTITGVYVNSTRSTHHEGFCSIAGMQYRISSTSHTQTEATAMLKTSTASEQSPPPTEPTTCSSPRTHKSYTPLSALSNMQPPAGAPPHPHLPPPPHHHHHLCGMGQHRPPPDHYMGHGPISHQRPISPLGRRHGCSSAFSAPHCSSHPGSGGPSSPAQESEGFGSPLPSHGYFQPAGPLIHHHSSSSGSVKNQNLTSLDSSSASESQRPGSTNEEPSESVGRAGENPPPPPPSAAHHMGYPRGYPPYQSGYYQSGYYPPPPQSAHYQPPPPPPAFHQHYHHHQDLCYPPGYPPSTYPPPPGSYRRFLQPPSSYYSPELTYGSSGPPPSQDHGAQQMVVPGGPSSSYSGPLDSYPPPPTPYYPGYSPGPSPACYSHPPSSRNLAFIEQTYQSCPCPMQLCPKNVHIGPLTGECKRPGTLPLPPVALHLPQEPPGAAGPPSPARGSAGMPPQPSPVSSTARPNHGPTWDGRPVKSSTEMKWEESKTSLELKPSTKYKSEALGFVDTKEIWDLSSRKTGFTELETKSAKSVESEWNVLRDGMDGKEPENYSQGLLAISSKDMTLLTTRTQLKEASTAPTPTEHIDDSKKIKSETITPPAEAIEPPKKQDDTAGKQETAGEGLEQKPEEKVSENIPNNEEGSKKRKRKVEPTNENVENKAKKVKKSENGKRKDENECADVKVSTKSQNTVNVKVKLLRDRNETVVKNEDAVRAITEGSAEESDKQKEAEGEKIISRRKSNQERSGICFPAPQALRKSKSCSPSRFRSGEQSPARLLREDPKRKLETVKQGKSKAETKGRTIQEHSKATGKGGRGKANGGTNAKVGKQMSILSRCSQANAASSGSTRSRKSVSILKKSASRKALSGSPRAILAPKWSNGWSWDSESFDAKVYLTNDEPPVMRKCYTAMRHVEGDVIHPKDCILLKAGPRRIDLPFVAKVAALWENPDDGEMMVSLLWYYRPEHTDQGRQPSDEEDEIFASRHKDINSVACIEDKCFVLTYNEYCRYRKEVRRVEEGVGEKNVPVPRLEQPYFRVQRQPPCVMAPDMVFFCRRVYDFRQKRLLKNPA